MASRPHEEPLKRLDTDGNSFVHIDYDECYGHQEPQEKSCGQC